jgi:excinuclease UvrABC nuclease subunit
MPFEQFGALMFTATSVERNAPASSGVYGLSNSREWIYVGESGDIRAQLLRHLHEQGTSLREKSATGFTYELCSATERIARQNQLVRELEPVCNRRPHH